MDYVTRDNLDFTKAPQKGILLAYFRTKVIFDTYEIVEKEIKSSKYGAVQGEKLLELHLFNSEKEYRAVLSGGNKYIQTEICRESDGDTIEEEMYLSEKFQKFGDKLKVVNLLSYDDSGMIRIENYRLAGVMEGGSDNAEK